MGTNKLKTENHRVKFTKQKNMHAMHTFKISMSAQEYKNASQEHMSQFTFTTLDLTDFAILCLVVPKIWANGCPWAFLPN